MDSHYPGFNRSRRCGGDPVARADLHPRLAPPIKTIITIVVVLFVCIWLLGGYVGNRYSEGYGPHTKSHGLPALKKPS